MGYCRIVCILYLCHIHTNAYTRIYLRYESKFSQQESLISSLTTLHSTTKKELIDMTKDTNSYKEDVLRLQDKEKRLIETIRGLENDIQQHKKEIRSEL